MFFFFFKFIKENSKEKIEMIIVYCIFGEIMFIYFLWLELGRVRLLVCFGDCCFLRILLNWNNKDFGIVWFCFSLGGLFVKNIY